MMLDEQDDVQVFRGSKCESLSYEPDRSLSKPARTANKDFSLKAS